MGEEMTDLERVDSLVNAHLMSENAELKAQVNYLRGLADKDRQPGPTGPRGPTGDRGGPGPTGSTEVEVHTDELTKAMNRIADALRDIEQAIYKQTPVPRASAW